MSVNLTPRWHIAVWTVTQQTIVILRLRRLHVVNGWSPWCRKIRRCSSHVQILGRPSVTALPHLVDDRRLLFRPVDGRTQRHHDSREQRDPFHSGQRRHQPMSAAVGRCRRLPRSHGAAVRQEMSWLPGVRRIQLPQRLPVVRVVHRHGAKRCIQTDTEVQAHDIGTAAIAGDKSSMVLTYVIFY